MFLGSGSVRVDEMDPTVTLADMLACFPYDDKLVRYYIPGDVLRGTFAHVMRNENHGGEGECYQVNSGVAAVYDTTADELVSLAVGGEPVDAGREYSICLQGYHANQSEAYLAIPTATLEASGKQKVVATSAQQVREEGLRDSKNLESVIEGRLVYR